MNSAAIWIGYRNQSEEGTLTGIINKIKNYLTRDIGVSQDDALTLLIKSISEDRLSKEQVMNIPAVKGCIDYIAGKIAPLKIKLYHEHNGEITEIKNDIRTSLLNIDTKDELSGVEWKKAVVEDYFLNGSAYLYKNSTGNRQISLNYVKSENVATVTGTDPIFKYGYYLIGGKRYESWDLVKIMRNTRDGFSGRGIMADNMTMLSLAYFSMIYEKTLLKGGGNRRGFLSSESKLTKEQMDKLKADFNKLYSNADAATVVVLNKGVKFEQASNSAVDLQLGENRDRNVSDVCKLFGVSPSVITGGGNENENSASIINGVMPVINAIEAALNRDYLLESEKNSSNGDLYRFEFDKKTLDNTELVKRYKAYESAVKAGWITKNEIRYKEDMPFIDGLDILTMSLGEVIFDTNTKTYYIPNKDVKTKLNDPEKKIKNK